MVKWILGEIGRVSSELGDSELPQKTDDTIKAQILLGYLARDKKAKVE